MSTGLFLTVLGFFGTDEIGKKLCDFGENTTIFGGGGGGGESAIFIKIGKVYLLNWAFSANWECSRSIGNFFSQLRKKFGTGNRTQFCIEKKPRSTLYMTFTLHNFAVISCSVGDNCSS